MGKWDRFMGQLTLSRSTKVTGKENNYRNALSVSNIIVSRIPNLFLFFISRYLQTKLYRVTSIAMHRADTTEYTRIYMSTTTTSHLGNGHDNDRLMSIWTNKPIIENWSEISYFLCNLCHFGLDLRHTT